MKKNILFIALSLLLIDAAITVKAQSIVRGRITDVNNNIGLPGTTIRISGSDQSTSADEKGDFQLKDVPADAVLEIAMIGYESLLYPLKGNENSFLNISLSPSTTELAEVVITGYESQRRLTEVAGGIAVLKPAEIQRYSNNDLQLTMNTIPGVRMEATGPSGSTRLSIRGSLLRSPFGIRGVKAYWNDLPLTDAGGSTPYDVFEPSILGSMEVLKGPSGSIYGAGTGGVLLFTTALPRNDEKSLEAGYSIGSYGLRRYGLTASVGTNNVRFQVSYHDQSYDGYRLNMTTYRRVFNMTGQVYTSEKGVLSMYAYHVKRNFDIPGGLTLEEYQADPFQTLPFVVANRTRLTSDATNVGLSYQHDLASNLTATASVYAINNNTPEHPTGSSQFDGSFFAGQSNGLGGRGKLVWSPMLGSIKSRFTVGAEIQTDRNRSSSFRLDTVRIGELDPTRPTAHNEVVTTQSILFGQVEFDLPYQIIATVGASYNNLTYDVQDFLGVGSRSATGKLETEPAFAPRIALVKKITSALSVHGSIARGFSPPGRNEINVNGRINSSLLPEDGINYEVGVRGSLLRGRLQLDATAYSMQLKNIIIRNTLNDGTSLFTNGGASSQRGIEAMLGYVFFNKNTSSFFAPSKLWLNYTLQDYTFKDYVITNENTNTQTVLTGNQIPGISPNVITAGFDLNTRVGLYANLTYLSFSDRYITNANDVKDQGYMLFNTKLGYRKDLSKNIGLHLYAGVENAGDSRYVGSLGLNGTRVYNLGQPRAFFSGIDLKYRF